MNKWIGIGRLTANPEVKYGEEGTPRATYTLAVDKRFKREGQAADFIPCIAFGDNAKWAEKWLTKGIKIAVEGGIQTGRYKNKDDKMVYTWNVVVSTHEFCESKKAQEENQASNAGPIPTPPDHDFVEVTDDLSELPFS